MVRSRKAFSLVELLVATSIITLVAVSATVNLTRVRQNSRDGRRKSDIQVYNQAIASYQLAKGTSFIQITGQGCDPTPADAPNNPASGAGCVGANGRSYGLLNLASGTTADTVYNVTPALTDQGRTYRSQSMAEALQSAGYLREIATDPLTKLSGGHTTDATARDYIVIRCCKDGRQSISTSGGAYSVWATLESSVSDTDRSNAAALCGGSGTATQIGAKYPALNPYTYDFANGTAGRPSIGVGTTINTSSELCPVDRQNAAS